MLINADTMNVYLVGTEETQTYEIERIEVAGNVRVVQENVTIEGVTGVYRYTEQNAVIEGNAEQQARGDDGTNIITADRIILLLTNNDMEAEGNVVVKFSPSGTQGQNE
jgi:lipopolysaccharide export system protein LptA